MNALARPAELLNAFQQVLAIKELEGYSPRVAGSDKGRLELRLEAGSTKHLIPLRLHFHPSRRILTAPDDRTLHLAPHLPGELAADLREAGINHADANGRLFIKAPGLLLDREPRGRAHTSPTADPDLFAAKTARIVRALLSRHQSFWTQADLVARAGVSAGLVSRTLKTLTENLYVLREPNPERAKAPDRYSLLEPDALLDAWALADDWNKRTEVHQYSLLTDDPREIAGLTRDALGPETAVFTQWFAASLRRPFTTPPWVTAYVDRASLKRVTFARKVDQGGNLHLVVPADAGVFLERQIREGFTLVSDPQIYLDLLRVGHRGEEQARELRAADDFGA